MVKPGGETLKKGMRIAMPITDVAFGGDGVGRWERFAVFVPFAVDGDEVEAEVVEVKKRYGRAKLLQVISPSLHRVAPACLYYGLCGGCRLQHIAYPHQLELKGRQVAAALSRIAGLPGPSVAPVIASPLPLGYRGKAEFHVSGGQVRRAGLMALASHDLVEVERCALVDESINRQYEEFRRLLKTGELETAVARQVLWSTEPGAPPVNLRRQVREEPEIERDVAGKRFAVSYRGFFQANLSLVAGLVGEVVRHCALTGRETLVDAYGGVGLFSAFLSAGAGRTILIEKDEPAVRCARRNLERLGLTRTEVLEGDVADVLAGAFGGGARADVVVLDPPRDGCGDGVIDRVAALAPRRIVYVSCNPATLARDLNRLAGQGYGLGCVQPFDMFPQTAHIEVVTLLTRSDGPAEGGG